MSESSSTKAPTGGAGLIALSWLTSLAGLPMCFLAIVGWGMSATSSPHAGIGELMMLFAAPIVTAGLLVSVFAKCKVTALRFVALVIPALLAVGEFLFACMVWNAG